jgi:hypothetical protein
MSVLDVLQRGFEAVVDRCTTGRVKPNPSRFYACPNCSASIDSMELEWGGIRRRQGRFIGKMGILCNGCGRRHTFRGKDQQAIFVYARLVNKFEGIRRERMLKGNMTLSMSSARH